MFYGADGTNSWDVNFVAEGSPYITGTHTGAGGATVLQDTSKFWTPNQWVGYSVQNRTKSQTITFGVVFSNTMTFVPAIFSPGAVTFDFGDAYRVYKVRLALDAPGQGLCDVITGNPPVPVGWPNQQFDTCYGWSNVINGTLSTWASAVPWALYNDVNSNYCNNIVKAGWTPYTYPHPAQTATALPPATPNTPSPADGAVNVDSAAVTLGWASLYSFYHDIKFDTVNPPVAVVATTWDTNNFSLTPLSAGTTYYWKVTSQNIDGTATSPVFSFTTTAPTPTTSLKPLLTPALRRKL